MKGIFKLWRKDQRTTGANKGSNGQQMDGSAEEKEEAGSVSCE